MASDHMDALHAVVRRCVAPKSRKNPWQWAHEHVELSVRVTNSPGKYDSSWIKYVQEWHEAFTDPHVRHVVICAGAQMSKTETLMNCVRYAVGEDPGPLLWVMPAESIARSFSESRLQPSLEDCPPCAAQIPASKDKFKLLEYQLKDMVMNLAGANSPGQLASRPVRYLFLDEVDKFPEASSREAGAVDLAKVRTTTFWNRKIMETSTPTVESGVIWQAYLKGDRRKYYCPCPRCDAMIDFDFEHVKWPMVKDTTGGWDLTKVEEEAYYQCQECNGEIRQSERATMLRLGEWRATNPDAPGDMRSYHISSLYSPWRSWGSIAREFLTSKESYSGLQNFTNSVLGLPWKQHAEEVTTGAVRDKKGNYMLKDIPEGVKAFTASCDVGRDYLAVTLRGWGEKGESWLIDYGMCPDFKAVTEFCEPYELTMGMMDSGFRTQEVYEFCSRSDRVWWPSKGHDTQNEPVRASSIMFYEGESYRERRIKLFHFNAGSFKSDLYLRRIQDDEGPPWHLPQDAGKDFLKQLTAERLVPKKNARGVEVQVWETIRRDNHYGDCEVMQLVMGHLISNKLLPKIERSSIEDDQLAKSRQRARKRSLSKKTNWRR